MKTINPKKRIYSYCLILIMILLLSAFYIYASRHSKGKKPITDTQFALNTVITITLYDTQDTSILDGAFELCRNYENVFSRTLESSELYQLNHSDKKTFTVSSDLASLISTGLTYSNLSKGAFDISIAPVSQLWDFTADSPKVPSSTDITANLPYVGYQNFTLNGTTLTRNSTHNQLDLGAIAKGYIADRIKDYLLSNTVKSAIINLGGNILCVGSKEGAPFNIGVQAPFRERSQTIASLQISDRSIVTSGIYERYFTKGEKLYHHILNPKTGYSYENDLIAVTILSDDSVTGDALSTTCFALGYEDALTYLNTLPNVDGILITSDNQLHYTDNFPK